MGLGGLNPEPRQEPVGPSVTERLSDRRPPEPRESLLTAPEARQTLGEPPQMPDTTTKDSSVKRDINGIYLSAVAIVAIIAVTVISWNASANSSAVIGLMGIANAAVGGMAGVALQKRS